MLVEFVNSVYLQYVNQFKLSISVNWFKTLLYNLSSQIEHRSLFMALFVLKNVLEIMKRKIWRHLFIFLICIIQPLPQVSLL